MTAAPEIYGSNTGAYVHAEAAVPSDTVDCTFITRGLLIGVAGTLKIGLMDGSTVSFANVPAGVLSIRATRVWSTGTAATGIVLLG